MRLIDEIHLEEPYLGSRGMKSALRIRGHKVGRIHVRTLMRKMGLEAIYPKPNLSLPGDDNRRYPYLLRDMAITTVNEVWSTDITYIRLSQGFIYLVAVIDWFSRYVLSWQVSNTMDVGFCLEALEQALHQGQPVIFNTEQVSQFTSAAFTWRLERQGIQISQDGRGRALDNIFVERLWRSVKYEEVYLKSYTSVLDAVTNLNAYFSFYNHKRLHQSLNYRTPAIVHFG